jgi:hypothetical protein
MQVNLPPDLESLVKKRLSSGGYDSIEEVFRRALEAQDAEESLTTEERRTLTAHIEEGFKQAERGYLRNLVLHCRTQRGSCQSCRAVDSRCLCVCR